MNGKTWEQRKQTKLNLRESFVKYICENQKGETTMNNDVKVDSVIDTVSSDSNDTGDKKIWLTPEEYLQEYGTYLGNNYAVYALVDACDLCLRGCNWHKCHKEGKRFYHAMSYFEAKQLVSDGFSVYDIVFSVDGKPPFVEDRKKTKDFSTIKYE